MVNPLVAGFIPEYGEKQEPTIFIDMSEKVASKDYDGVWIQRFKSRGMTDEQIAKMTLVETMFEEAQHCVDFLEGKLSKDLGPTGIHPDHKGTYYEQEHEMRAEKFRREMIEKHKELYESGEEIYFKTAT